MSEPSMKRTYEGITHPAVLRPCILPRKKPVPILPRGIVLPQEITRPMSEHSRKRSNEDRTREEVLRPRKDPHEEKPQPRRDGYITDDEVAVFMKAIQDDEAPWKLFESLIPSPKLLLTMTRHAARKAALNVLRGLDRVYGLRTIRPYLCTAIVDAVLLDHLEVVEMLIRLVHPADLKGTILAAAVTKGNVEMIELIMSVSQTGRRSAFMEAVRAEKFEAASILSTKEKDDRVLITSMLNSPDLFRETMSELSAPTKQRLLATVYGMHDAFVATFIEELPKEDIYGALMWATECGHPRMFQSCILRWEAPQRDSLALRRCARYGHETLLRSVLESSDPCARNHEALRSAAGFGHLACLQVLLEHCRCNADEVLHHALQCAIVSGGHHECVKAILASSESFMKHPSTHEALLQALNRGYSDCVAALLPFCDKAPMRSAALQEAKTCSERKVRRHQECMDLIQAWVRSW